MAVKKVNDGVHKDKGSEAAVLLQREVDEWKSKYMRALADYQNLEKRSQDMVDQSRRFASEVIIARLIPVLDTFAKVREHIHDVGFDLAHKELIAVLTEQGVVTESTVGKPFDPHEMECVEVVEGKENVVMEELLPLYRFRGKVLRVAQVKVGKTGVQS